MIIKWQIFLALTMFCVQLLSAEAIVSNAEFFASNFVHPVSNVEPEILFSTGLQYPEYLARNFVHLGSYEERDNYSIHHAPCLQVFKESAFGKSQSSRGNAPSSNLTGRTTIAACIKSVLRLQGARYAYGNKLIIKVYDYEQFMDSIQTIATQIKGERVARNHVSKILSDWFVIDHYFEGFRKFELTVKPDKIEKYRETIQMLQGFI